LKVTTAQGVQRPLCGEHRLIVVCVKIPSNNEPIYGRDFRSDEVADMRHQLIYGDFSFSDILCRFGYRIAVRDEVALRMNGINTNVSISNLEPRISESAWWVVRALGLRLIRFLPKAHPSGFVYVARLPPAPFPPGTFSSPKPNQINCSDNNDTPRQSRRSPVFS